MNGMFDKCWNLETLPDISKWDTSNVTDMSTMFSGCFQLKALPDISKWNTKKVQHMYDMLGRLGKVELFPDISKWEINACDIGDASHIIVDCIFNPIINYRLKKKITKFK